MIKFKEETIIVFKHKKTGQVAIFKNPEDNPIGLSQIESDNEWEIGTKADIPKENQPTKAEDLADLI